VKEENTHLKTRNHNLQKDNIKLEKLMESDTNQPLADVNPLQI
jgi:hypothetical protein